jgi:hypothetical protein
MANRTQNDKPTPRQALAAVRELLSICVYPDIDARTKSGATKLAARWAMGFMALDALKLAVAAYEKKQQK